MPFFLFSSDDPIVTSLVKHKEFDELVHWHSHRPLSDDYDRTKVNSGDRRDPNHLKRLQKYHSFQRFYGESLESVTSKTITTQGPKPKKDCIKSKSTKAHVCFCQHFIIIKSSVCYFLLNCYLLIPLMGSFHRCLHLLLMCV